MYRVGIGEQFGLDAYPLCPAVALPPDYQRIALWINDDLGTDNAFAVAENGEPIELHVGTDRLAAYTLLLILKDPALTRWTATRSRVLTMVPTWAAPRLPLLERMVVQRLIDVNRLSGTGAGQVESVVWDWEPGQAVGRVAVVILNQRVFYPFQLRGHTLYFRDRVTNVTVDLPRELAMHKVHGRNRQELVGDIFPDDEEGF